MIEIYKLLNKFDIDILARFCKNIYRDLHIDK